MEIFFPSLVVFSLAVYGLSNALAVLKIGCYIFGDPVDQIICKNGDKISWVKLKRSGDAYEGEDEFGNLFRVDVVQVEKVNRRKGLGRIPYIGALFYCPACLSFWIGMACSMWVLSPAFLVCPIKWKAILLDGFMASAVSWLLHVAAMKFAHGVEDA